MRIFLVALCLYMIWGHRANANSNTNTTIMPLAQQPEKKRLSLSVDLSFDSNFRESNDPDYSANTTLSIAPTYQLSPLFSLAGQIVLEQKLYADQKTQVSNTTFTLSRRALEMGQARTLSPSVFVVLPTNEHDRNKNTLRSAAGLALSASQKMSLLKTPSSLIYSFSALKNFHEYENNNLYGANLSHRVRHILALQMDISGPFAFEILGLYQTGWTYQNALRTTFMISEQISWSFDESNSIYISHTNDGAALKANGVDSNIKVYDKSTSTYTVGMVATY